MGIPRECKRLAEVDFPIAEVSKHAARVNLLHLILAPAAALSLTVLAYNFLGDGLRDALDPHLGGREARTVRR